MTANEIDLKRYSKSYPASLGNIGSDNISLTDEQQSTLKELMCNCTAEQLDCIADCCRSMSSDLKDHLSKTITVDDFDAAKAEPKDDNYGSTDSE